MTVDSGGIVPHPLTRDDRYGTSAELPGVVFQIIEQAAAAPAVAAACVGALFGPRGVR
ncbi:MAG: hypothetical protein LBD90_09375 [Bifidobacteriaceae bacterium]|jgi:hypothetical protein|nr:hypothetical protein [Bifidobacteriaceae bacterium]